MRREKIWVPLIGLVFILSMSYVVWAIQDPFNYGQLLTSAALNAAFNSKTETTDFKNYTSAHKISTSGSNSYIDAKLFANFSTSVHDSSTAGKMIIVSTPLSCNNLTVPSDRTILGITGGSVNIASGKTLNINSSVEDLGLTGLGNVNFNGITSYQYATLANTGSVSFYGPFNLGKYYIFTGGGTISGLSISYPDWFKQNAIPGTTDMTSAILAASITSSIVKFNGSTYLSGQVNLPNRDTKIIGENTIITGTSGAGNIFYQTNGGVLTEISGIKFTGGKTAFYRYATSLGSTPFKEYDIHDNWFALNTGIYALQFSYSREGYITNNKFDSGNTTMSGIYATQSIGQELRGNYFYNNSYALNFYDGMKNIKVLGGEISNCAYGISTYNLNGIDIVGVNISNNDNPIQIQSSNSISITNNNISSRSSAPAIATVSVNNGTNNNIIIANNPMITCNATSGNTEAINLQYTNSSNISGNNISGFRLNGINYSNSNNLNIIGNNIIPQLSQGTYSITEDPALTQNIAASQVKNSNGVNLLTGSINLPIPRRILIYISPGSGSGIYFIITGNDAYGNSISETDVIGNNTFMPSINYFKSVNNITLYGVTTFPITVSAGTYNGANTVAVYNNYVTLPINTDSTFDVFSNKGFATESNGQVTILSGGSSTFITHGLSRVPQLQNIRLTPLIATTLGYNVDTITTTSFRIHLSGNAPTGGLPFGWAIQIK
jgi:hypothetical protein